MKRSTASTKRSGWRGYGDPAEGQDSSSSASSSEYGSPAAKSPREASAASDQSQANFDFSGLDQTFAGLTQTPTHDLTGGVGLSMPKRGAKGHTPQKPIPTQPTIQPTSTAIQPPPAKSALGAPLPRPLQPSVLGSKGGRDRGRYRQSHEEVIMVSPAAEGADLEAIRIHLMELAEHRAELEQEDLDLQFLQTEIANISAEALAYIKAMQNQFRKQTLRLDEFLTATALAEDIINGRPLDYTDGKLFTPNHLILRGPPQEALPIIDLDHIGTIGMRHQLIEDVTQRIWIEYRQGWLYQAQRLPKWQEYRKNLELGTMVVMFNEDNFKSTRNQWDVGRIVSLTRGADNQARKAVVTVERPQNKEGQYDLVTHERAVNKLVPIDLIADQVQRILPVDITKYPAADLAKDEHPQPQRDDPIDCLEQPPEDVAIAVGRTPTKSTSNKVNTQKIPIATQHQNKDTIKSMTQKRVSSTPNHGE
jgi:hypothetical protein